MELTIKRIYGDKLLDDVKRSARKTASSDVADRLFKLLFLCGAECGKNGDPSKTQCNRSKVALFLAKHRKDVKCVNVEDFTDKFLNDNMDLFTFEEFIALLCDGILLFAESWGSVCELGAFSSRDSMAQKMIVVNDKKYEGELSFINQGPIRRLQEFGEERVVYADIEAIFSNSTMHQVLIDCVPRHKTCKLNADPRNISLSAYMHEVLDIIWLFGPISSRQISAVYKWLKGFDSYSFFDRGVHGASLQDKVQPKHVLDVLELLGYIHKENDYYTLSDQQEPSLGFFLNMSDKKYQSIRARVVARKYKYKDGYGGSGYANVQ